SAKSISMVLRIGRSRGACPSVAAQWTNVRASAAADDASDLGDRGAPLLDLLQTVVAQARHPLPDGHVADRLGGLAFQRHRLDLGGHVHDLIQTDASAIAAAAAAPAA